MCASKLLHLPLGLTFLYSPIIYRVMNSVCGQSIYQLPRVLGVGPANGVRRTTVCGLTLGGLGNSAICLEGI